MVRIGLIIMVLVVAGCTRPADIWMQNPETLHVAVCQDAYGTTDWRGMCVAAYEAEGYYEVVPPGS